MEQAALDRWYEMVRTPGPLLSGAVGPASGAPPSHADQAISGVLATGPAAADVRSLDADRRQRFGAGFHPERLNASDLEVYLRSIENDPAVGLFIITKLCWKKSGWSPVPDAPGNTPDLFKKYLDILSGAPLIELLGFEQHQLYYREENYNGLIDAAADLFEGLAKEDSDRVKQALRTLAKAATSNIEKEQSTKLFAQNQVSLDVGKIGYDVFFSDLSLKMRNKKAHVLETTLTVYQLHLQFRVDMWKSGAYRKIGKWDYSNLDDWREMMETPEGEGPKQLCFE